MWFFFILILYMRLRLYNFGKAKKLLESVYFQNVDA
jgi:hypothetical protein